MFDVQDYPEIVPKNADEARGIDFCGTDDYYYIIRSDLGVYMRCTNFNERFPRPAFSTPRVFHTPRFPHPGTPYPGTPHPVPRDPGPAFST